MGDRAGTGNETEDSFLVQSLDLDAEEGSELAMSNSSLDMLEQHQAKEQARLLQRFRELRQWQQQQQQQLMQQQQQQLQALQVEQSKVSTLIANQQGGPRAQGPGVLRPSHGGSRSPIMTPPSKPRSKTVNGKQESRVSSQSQGISLDSGLISMQDTLKSQCSLPKPVMYIDPSKSTRLEDYDRYTSSELFSNPGSCTDQMEILLADDPKERQPPPPDWMSDSSENFIAPRLPPPRPSQRGPAALMDQMAGLEHLLNTAPAGLLQQVLGLLPGGGATNRGQADLNQVELSASPTLPGPQLKNSLQQEASNLRTHVQRKPSPAFLEQGGQDLSLTPPRQSGRQQSVKNHAALHQHFDNGKVAMAPKLRQVINPYEQWRSLGGTDLEVLDDPRYIPRSVHLQDDDLLGEHVDYEDSPIRNDAYLNADSQDEEEEEDVGRNKEEEEDENAVLKEVGVDREEDRPIKGIAGHKTFEQLLEEQLRQEEEARHQAATGVVKQPFLKKGEGISRFSSVPKKPVKRPTTRSNQARLAVKGDNSKVQPNAKNQESDGVKKDTVGSRLKSMSGSASASGRKEAGQTGKGTNQPSAPVKPPVETSNNQAATKLTLIRTAASKKLEEQRLRQQAGGDEGDNQPPRSLVESSPSLESRSNIVEDPDSTELDSLAEFELLEDVADNMSFCSNSSLFHRLVAGDRRGHKEAMTKLKTVTETKKSQLNSELSKVTGSSNSTRGTQAREVTAKAASQSSNVQEAATDILDRQPSSGDSTPTYSSTEESEDEDVKDNSKPSLARSSQPSVPSQQFPQPMEIEGEPQDKAPTASNQNKVLTRKVAPMAAKFSQANDTLSMLRTLSLQANVLTANQNSNNSNMNLVASQPVSIDSMQWANGSGLSQLAAMTSAPSGLSSNQLSVPVTNQLPPPTSNPPPSTSHLHIQPGLSAHNGHHTFGENTDLASSGLAKSYVSQRYSTEEGSSSDSESSEEESEEEVEEEKIDGAAEMKGVQDSADQKNSEKDDDELAGVSNGFRGGFDDETEWVDDDNEDDEKNTCLKSVPGAVSGSHGDGVQASTPPTSKLVSRLFPKLKTTQPSQPVIKAPAPNAVPVDGVQSRILREKLSQLDAEIERFRSENTNLDRLRREREEGVAKLKQEIQAFQKEKEEELRRLEEFKTAETKKLKRERKLFDSYQKKVRSMPDKKEREEIESLKNQLQEVQDELKRKEARWSATTARLKNRVAEVELENGELREEVRILERKRLEWMTAQSNAKVAGSSNKSEVVTRRSEGKGSQPRSSTPTEGTERPKVTSAPSNVVAPAMSAPATAPAVRPAIPTATSARHHSAPVTNGPHLSQAPVVVNGNMSGEGMPAQNVAVPVMAENTIPSSAVSSQVHVTSSVDAGTTKSAAMLAMEKAVVDKGDVTACVENRHPDGKVEKTYKTGTKEIHFPNGTVKEISPDGQTIVCRLANGDIRQIFPDHRVVYIFALAEILQTTFPDGLETYQFKNGQIEKRYPDGTVEITFPSKDVKYLFPDGGQEVILTDGTVMQYSSGGERTVEYPSGDREVHTAEYQRREFPDGIIKTVYSDGRHETRFPNGRVRMRDKAGNVIMDQICYR